MNTEQAHIYVWSLRKDIYSSDRCLDLNIKQQACK